MTPFFLRSVRIFFILQCHYDIPGVSQSEYPSLFFHFFENKLVQQDRSTCEEGTLLDIDERYSWVDGEVLKVNEIIN
jgi:hypothetical protein